MRGRHSRDRCWFYAVLLALLCVLGAVGAAGVVAATSVRVVAPTQAGKTSRFVVPAVLRWEGPLVVTSVKTDVLRLTHGERTRRGRVHVFDPTGSTDFATTKWSPLLACVDYPAADRVASWLVQAAGEGRAGENARFWEGLGAKLLAPLLFAAAHAGGGLRQVSAWIDRRQTIEVTELLAFLADTDAIDAWAASCAREERQRDSVYATAESILKGFASPSARAATQLTGADHVAGRVLDVRKLVADGETLYLVAPAPAQAQLRPLFEALVQAVLRAAQDAYAATGAPLDPPLLLMLDEAANSRRCAIWRRTPPPAPDRASRSARSGRTSRRSRPSTGARPRRWSTTTPPGSSCPAPPT